MPTRTWTSLAQRVSAELADWGPATSSQKVLREECLALLQKQQDKAVRKGAAAEHVTASCFVLSPPHDEVLLTLHGKADRWLQLGGHIELADAGAAGAAQREATEEAGVPGISLLSTVPVDVDHQRLQGRFGGCAVHWDIGFLAVAEHAGTPVVSDESHDVKWWRLSDLEQADAAVAQRLHRALS